MNTPGAALVTSVRDRSAWKLVVIAALAVIGFTLAGGLVVRSAMEDAATTQLRADLAPLNRTVAELRDTLRAARTNPTPRNIEALAVAGDAYTAEATAAKSDLDLPDPLRRTINETTTALAPAERLAGRRGSGPILLKAATATDGLSAAIEAVSNLDTRLAVGEVLAIDNAVNVQAAIVSDALASQTVLTPNQRAQLEITLPVEAQAVQQFEDFVPPELAKRLNQLTATPAGVAFNDTVARVLAATSPADFGITSQQFEEVANQYELERAAVAADLRDSIAQAAAQAAQTSVARAWATGVIIVAAITLVIALTALLGSDIIRQQRRTTALNADLDLRATELARSNADLHNFATAASHDLKEPLRMVTMVSSRLTDAYPVGTVVDERAVAYLTSARDSAEHMTQLLADLFAYAQTAQTDHTLFGPVDVADVVRRSWESNAAQVQETHAELIVRTPLPVLPEASSLLLGQVFANLFSNALKYRHSDVIPQIEIAARRESDGWRFDVYDNGIGIEPEYREQIFEIFKRLHTAAEYEGTGVGLALVKNIVTAHGGEISVRSNGGVGSTFSFTISDGSIG